MPWTEKQNRLFQGVAHGSIKRKGLSPKKAKKLLSEGDAMMGGMKKAMSKATGAMREKSASPVHGRGDKQVDLNRKRKLQGDLMRRFMDRFGGKMGGRMAGNHPAGRLFQGDRVARTIRGRGR